MTSFAHPSRRALCAAACVAGAALLAACAGPVAGPVANTAANPAANLAGQHYHCEHGISVTVRFVDDTAVLDGARGREVLYRDAGGVTASQTVYSNAHLRAEFGLGASGREALLRYPEPPLLARCARD